MDDELRALIEPLRPPWPERSPGHKPVEDRLGLQGIILFVLYTGYPNEKSTRRVRAGLRARDTGAALYPESGNGTHPA